MSAYLISDVRAKDPRAFDIYQMRAAASVEQYGGRFLARGGATRIIVGCWAPQAIEIVEFDTPEQATAWYDSPEYALALALREEAPNGDLILVDGVSSDSD
jgi:uncharacterized protein (DUF1330 family)